MEIVSIAIATLVVLVLAHFAVYYVVRTLYPPPPAAPAPVPVPAAAPEPVFIQPPEQHQDVRIPTYETPLETTRKEGATPIGELQNPPVQRDTGVDSVKS